LNFSSKLFIQVSCMFFGVVHVAGLLNLLQPICQVFVVALVVVQVSHLLLLVALLLLLPCAGAPVDPVRIRNISEALGVVSIAGAYKPFSFAFTVPHMCFKTSFAGNSCKGYVDFYVHTHHPS
jgi:hypothetical protein